MCSNMAAYRMRSYLLYYLGLLPSVTLIAAAPFLFAFLLYFMTVPQGEKRPYMHHFTQWKWMAIFQNDCSKLNNYCVWLWLHGQIEIVIFFYPDLSQNTTILVDSTRLRWPLLKEMALWPTVPFNSIVKVIKKFFKSLQNM